MIKFERTATRRSAEHLQPIADGAAVLLRDSMVGGGRPDATSGIDVDPQRNVPAAAPRPSPKGHAFSLMYNFPRALLTGAQSVYQRGRIRCQLGSTCLRISATSSRLRYGILL